MTLTRYGIREWGGGGLVALLLAAGFVLLALSCCPVIGWILTGFTVIAYLGVAAFFRNPVRRIPADSDVILSSADGVVRDIEVVDFDQKPFQGKALRIGVFLSVLDVHVNRAAAPMTVEEVFYREGKFLDARDTACAKENEAMTISGTGECGSFRFPLAIRQISGAIARRIVCPVAVGRKLAKGEIYGMIKFGSRTEVYLPVDGFEVLVQIGDKVRGGTSILARVKKEEK